MANGTLRLGRIRIFPIKSLDGVEVARSAITPGGILENDRVFAIFDAEGRVVNGKRTDQIHRLRATFDDEVTEVSLRSVKETSPIRFQLDARAPLERWLSDFFGFTVTVRHDEVTGFPDDTDAFGPTITSTESLLRVCDWYPELSLESVRRRFRANLELEGGEAFCEDRLFGGPGERKPFRVGSVGLLGHNPCQRCVVPPRDPDTGATSRGFQKSFGELRERNLPEWSDKRRFDHFYRFAVNTSIPPSEAGKRLRVGDAVTL